MANKKLTVGLPADPNDPEDFDVSDAAIEQALAEREARRPRRVGRPEGCDKERTTTRLDNDLPTRFRSTGSGWPSRMNAALHAAILKLTPTPTYRGAKPTSPT